MRNWISDMTPENTFAHVGIREHPVEEELKQSYLTYAMSVIVSRALPDARDGLKPVQRRILTAMHDLNLSHTAKPRKCSKVVGDCMGKYHPHGNAPIYEALVRMAQDFSMRYPLVEGQGNFGSIDGYPAAAERYTECRMSEIASEMLIDIDKDTVNLMPNYDGTEVEPEVLPAKVPMLLVNGASGIAVGMATSIPPHNLAEVCRGIIALLDNPEISCEELMKHIPGPDFPTGGLICGKEGIKQAYLTGRGQVVVRAKCHIETLKNGRQNIVVTEIPFQVNLGLLVEKVAEVVKEERVQGVANIHDYSNKDGIRLCIELKPGEDANVVLNQLYKLTPLQDRFSIINIALVKGRPQTLNLKEMLECYRDHRFEVIRRRTIFLLNKAKARAHILEGRLKALDHIDEVIRLIREAPDAPAARRALVERFALTEVQAEDILAMPLRTLTGLERQKLEEEYRELQVKIADYTAILNDPALVRDIIREDCYELIDRYEDERRTAIVGAVEELTIEDLIADEEMAVVISHAGYIKRMPLEVYRRQGRGGRGVTGMGNLKDGDFIEHLFVASTHDYILFFSNAGQVHWLKVYDIPEMGRAAKGRALANVLALREGERISAMVPVRTFDDDHFLLLATKRGIIKKIVLSAFSRPMRGGIRAAHLEEGDELIDVVMTKGDQEVMLASRNGLACRFSERDVRPMGRAAIGVAGMRLASGDECVGLMVVRPQCTVLTVSEMGLGKRSSFEDYRLTRRAAKGVVNMRITDKTGPVVACMTVQEQDEIMVITAAGMVVRLSVASVRVIGRATQGVRLIRLEGGDKVVAVARVVGGEEQRGAGAGNSSVASLPEESFADDLSSTPTEEPAADGNNGTEQEE